MLALLRTKGLSIKDMEEGQKANLRAYLGLLTNEKGMSLNDVAKLVGNKTSGYTSWVCRQLGVTVRPFEEARLKGIREKRRKYERRPFDGTDEDKAYLLGLRHGDLSVSKPWKGVVRVSTSTTHPAMAELFKALFGQYGHVYNHPRYKKETDSYEVNLSVILDSSFEFLFLELKDLAAWLVSNDRILLGYLSGLLDAEGSIITTRDSRGLVTIFIDYYNSNLGLIRWVQGAIAKLGYKTSLRVNKKKGYVTKKYGIIHRSDYWQLSTYGIPAAQDFVKRLALRHGEKIRRKEMALSATKGQRYSEIARRNLALRVQIKQEVQDFVRRAELEYKSGHGESILPPAESGGLV